MRKDRVLLTERTFIYALAGQLFDQAPNRAPRKVDIIMDKAKQAFRAVATNDNEYYTLHIESDKLYSFVNDLLLAIPEFEELNLSQVEYEAGVGVHDETRPKFSFTSAYDAETTESWKRDFIDLDAFIRNVVNGIWIKSDEYKDCFGCINADTGKCISCLYNPALNDNLEYNRQPKGDYTFSCKYDCSKGYQICCEECTKDNDCTSKCSSSSCECGLALHKKS